eukprot:gene2622-24253_t
MRSGAQTSSTVPKKTAAAMPKDAWLINHLPSAGAKSVAASPCFDGRNTEASLMTHYYPRFRSKNKVAVAANAFPEQTTEWRAGDVVGAGKLRVTRWQAAGLPLPQAFPPSAPSVTLTQDIFIYTTSSAPAEGPCSSSSSGSSGSTATAATVPTKAVSSWYPNFAHRFLFAAWNSSLLAQDELQVLEFPVLAAIAQGPTKLTTVDPDGTPTPVLIQGPSIYGNAFAMASAGRIQACTTVLNPPTASNNIYAIEAPPSGKGVYTVQQVRFVLHSAYAAFAAIKTVEADATVATVANSSGTAATVELHLGYWGCGAYGGNKVLMTAIQLLAARLAGVEHVVFHGVPEVSDARNAVALLEEMDAVQDSGGSGPLGIF